MSYKQLTSDNDLIYVNLSFTNTAQFPQQAAITETRTTAILSNPSEYTMSVVRFDVDCHTIPINIPLMFTPPGGIPSETKTMSEIAIYKHDGSAFFQTVFFEADPTVIFPPPSGTPLGFKPVIYDYQTWLNFVNTAIQLALIAAGLPGAVAKFIFNAQTGLINLYVDENFMTNAGANQVFLGINQPLYQYFNNFEMIHNWKTFSNAPFYTQAFRITNFNTLRMPPIGSRQNLPEEFQAGPGDLFMCPQLEKGTGSWSSLRSIILTSNTIPLNPESISGPNQGNNYISSNILPIISDFLAPTEANVTNFRVVNEYLPTAEYRRIKLISGIPLTTLDVRFYWSDFLGNIYPLILQTNGGASIKLLFEKIKTL